jgi:hypothetical protein
MPLTPPKEKAPKAEGSDACGAEVVRFGILEKKKKLDCIIALDPVKHALLSSTRDPPAEMPILDANIFLKTTYALAGRAGFQRIRVRERRELASSGLFTGPPLGPDSDPGAKTRLSRLARGLAALRTSAQLSTEGIEP